LLRRRYPEPPLPFAQVEIDVDSEHDHPVSPGPDADLPVYVDEALDPRSAVSIMGAFVAGPNRGTLREVARVTNQTLTQHAETQQEEVDNLRNEIQRLRSQIAPTPQTGRTTFFPRGFAPNNGRYPHFHIPHQGNRARARYIRVCPTDPSIVEGTMGGTSGEIYSTPIYAQPYDRYGATEGNENADVPAEAMPEWFRDLLHGSPAAFATLLHGSRALNDWGITADIARYRSYGERVSDLYRARESIDASISGLRDNMDLASFRLGTAQASNRLPRFQNLANVNRGGSDDPYEERTRQPKRARGRAPA
jgi:hypothetical protein